MLQRPLDLRCSAEGLLYLLMEGEDGILMIVMLGPIEEAADFVPSVLYAVYERLLDEWRHGFDPRAEAEASWRIAKGM